MADFVPDNDSRGKEVALGVMSLVDHLQELRRRLIIAIITVAITSSGCYYYAPKLVRLATAGAGKLYYLHPAEAFFTYLKVSVFAGFVVALPVILYQAWAFIAPAITNKERKGAIILVPAAVLLFFTGLTFSYKFVLPVGIKFFLGFSNEDLQPLFSIGQYISFVISFLLPFGVVFELPLVIMVAAKFGLISSRFLVAKRKAVLVLAFVVGAVIAPSPDVFSQSMVAVPLVALYEISILIVRYVLQK